MTEVVPMMWGHVGHTHLHHGWGCVVIGLRKQHCMCGFSVAPTKAGISANRFIFLFLINKCCRCLKKKAVLATDVADAVANRFESREEKFFFFMVAHIKSLK